MKIVSVVIPCFNRANYIGEAVDSVLGQRLPAGYNLEVVVVDDGSTDNTEEVLSPYHGKITYIKTNNSGKPATPRNIGIKASKGSLIAFQDSDDVWAKDKLIKQIPLFDDPKVILSYGDSETLNVKAKSVNKSRSLKKSGSSDMNFEALLKQNDISTLTVIVRREALDAVGVFNESSSLRAVEDYELWLRILAKFPSGVKGVQETLAFRRLHDDNISTTNNTTALRRILNVYDAIWKLDLSKSNRQVLEDSIQTMQENWARSRDEDNPASRPIISVVMSVYNGAKFLLPAINSILSQTFKQFEFIIIDDGSSDSTPAILKEFDDPRIRVIRQVNHGLFYSLNKGVNLATAKYVARQDADDIALPSRFEKQLQLMLSNPKLGVVGTFFSYVDEESTIPTGVTICGPTKHVDIKRSMYFTNPIGHGTALIQRSVFTEMGLYNGDFYPSEDYELWTRISDNYEVGIVPDTLYLYRINQASISHTLGDKMHHFTDKIIEGQWAKPFVHKSINDVVSDGNYYKNLPSPFAGEVYGKYLSQQIDIGKALFERGRIKTGIKTAIGSWRLRHSTWRYFVRPFLRGINNRLSGRNT